MTIVIHKIQKIEPDFKKHGLSRTEFRSLFTLSEAVRNDECEAMINSPSYSIDGGSVSLDDDAAQVGAAGMTYRQLMRTGYAGFSKAEAIDVDHELVVLTVTCQSLLGLLDFPERKDVILQGLPPLVVSDEEETEGSAS